MRLAANDPLKQRIEHGFVGWGESHRRVFDAKPEPKPPAPGKKKAGKPRTISKAERQAKAAEAYDLAIAGLGLLELITHFGYSKYVMTTLLQEHFEETAKPIPASLATRQAFARFKVNGVAA